MANEVTIDIKVTGTPDAIAKLGLLNNAANQNTQSSGRLGNAIRAVTSLFGTMSGSITKLATQAFPQMSSSMASAIGNAGGGAGLAGLGVILVAIIGYLATILPELVAAGLGIAAFGALALPIFQQIMKGVHAVGKAVGDTAKDKAWSAIPAALRPAVQTILQIKQAWMDMSKSMTPLVGQIASTAGDIVKKLLPVLQPLAVEAGRAIEGLLKQFDRVASSQGFKNFFAEMTRLSGPAITAIGQGLGQVTGALVTFIKDLTSPNGIMVLEATFTVLAATIRSIGWAFKVTSGLAMGFAQFMLVTAHYGVVAAKSIGDAFLSASSTILRAMSHIPGLNFLKGWSDQVNRWKSGFDNSMNGAIGKVRDWQNALAAAPKIITLKGNIQDLQTKLYIAEQALKNPDLTKTRRASIEANIDKLKASIADARARLDALNGKTVHTFVDTLVGTIIGATNFGPPPPATGHGHGPGHRAAGGIASGLIEIGEHGRELIQVPAGSYVHSNPDTERMVSQSAGGGVQRVVLEWARGTGTDKLIAALQEAVRIRGGDPAMFDRKVAFR